MKKILLVIFIPLLFSFSLGKGNTSTKNDPTVYVTRTGKKYHHKGCGYLRSIGGTYTRSEAESRGYKACSRY